MLDTIAHIPTILAYTFISLLVAILCFIVIYVSHKVYASIYDNMGLQSYIDSLHTAVAGKNGAEMHRGVRLRTTPGNYCGKTKTALRIIVTIETCYLAYVIFELGSGANTDTQQQKKVHDLLSTDDESNYSLLQQQKILIKYFSRLTDIPLGKEMEPCKPPALHGFMNTFAKTVKSARRSQIQAPEKNGQVSN